MFCSHEKFIFPAAFTNVALEIELIKIRNRNILNI